MGFGAGITSFPLAEASLAKDADFAKGDVVQSVMIHFSALALLLLSIQEQGFRLRH
jgi:hypothetical protein